jgi:hypothetical protein
VSQLIFEQGTSRTHITDVTASGSLFDRSHEKTTGCKLMNTLEPKQAENASELTARHSLRLKTDEKRSRTAEGREKYTRMLTRIKEWMRRTEE